MHAGHMVCVIVAGVQPVLQGVECSSWGFKGVHGTAYLIAVIARQTKTVSSAAKDACVPIKVGFRILTSNSGSILATARNHS